jgi:mRNA interferase RelE/StbE
MYSVVITPSAEKDLRRLDRSVKNRVTVAILALAEDPRPAGCIKIKSEEGVWRIRVGEYRVAYTVDDQAKVVTIIRVGSRGDFYN